MVMHHLAIERGVDDGSTQFGRPITLPRLQWASDAEFRLFAKHWRIGKRRGLSNGKAAPLEKSLSGAVTHARRGQPQILSPTSREVSGVFKGISSKTQAVAQRKIESDAACMEDEESGEGTRDLVTLFAEATAQDDL
jgi:hypothetical protein